MKSARWPFFLILGTILFLSGGFISLDWSRLFLFDHPVDQYKDVLVTKWITSFLCSLLVWITGSKFYISTKDSFHLRIAFVVTFAGDTAFFFDKDLVGIGLFALGQVLLTIRNSTGLVAFFKERRHDQSALILGLLILCVNILILYFIFYPVMHMGTMFIAFSLYSLFLCVSVWVGCLAPRTGSFDPINGRLIAVAMICFYACDVTVGLGLALPEGTKQMVAANLTWVFYTPALTLLAISGYVQKRIWGT